jgi:hypothetical protein
MVGNTWLDAMFAELESFLKDSTHSPQLKLGAVKVPMISTTVRSVFAAVGRCQDLQTVRA